MRGHDVVATTSLRFQTDECTLHQPRHAEAREDAFAHDDPAQGADIAERQKARSAQEVRGEHAGQQGPVQPIHGGRAQADIEIAVALVAIEGLVRTRIVPLVAPIHHRVPQGRDIPEAEIEALRADGREHVRRLADEGEMLRPVAVDRQSAHGHEPARSVDAHGSQMRLRLPLDGERQCRVIELRQPFRLALARHPDEARAAAGQGHQGERTVAGMELGRGFPVLPVMGQDGRDRGLRVGPGPGFDPGDLAQLGIAPVAGDHEARFERRAVGKGQGRARPVGLEAGREGRHEGQVRAGPRRLGEGFDRA